MSNIGSKVKKNPFAGFTFSKLLTEGRAFIALAVIIVVFAYLSPNYLNLSNVIVMTRHVGLNALLAIGMLLVILTAGIDLSVGSTVGLSGVLAGFMLMQGIQVPGTHTVLYPSVWVIVVLCLFAGALVGLLNGILITRFKVAPFITTLRTLYVVRGTALLIAKGETFNDACPDACPRETGEQCKKG